MSTRRPYHRGAPAPAYVARAPMPQAKPSPAAPPVPLRKPVFTTVDKLLPQTRGHTLTARVLTARTVLEKGAAASPHLRRTRVAECLVGDHTGTVLFTARNEQSTPPPSLPLALASLTCAVIPIHLIHLGVASRRWLSSNPLCFLTRLICLDP